MDRLLELLGLSAAMGLAIYLSLPVVLYKATGSKSVTFLNAAAIGILVFLVADVFADAATLLYTNPTNPYLASPIRVAYFVAAVGGSFGALYVIEHSSREALSPAKMALMIAAAIGLQNLTEGLVFGEFWAIGSLGLSTVVFVGFFLQNVTEGFPITSPFLARSDVKLGPVALIFLVGGLPTVLGAVGGYFYTSTTVELVFDALAIGSILYAILPMLRIAMRPATPPETTYVRQRLLYAGVIVGFLVGFLVNAI
jgi:zinc transporter, ZIP family